MKSSITLSLIQNILLKDFMSPFYVDDDTSRRMWWSSLELIQKEFLNKYYQDGGLWVASPLPAINDKKYLNKLKGWLLAPKGFSDFDSEHAKYLPNNHLKSNNDNFKYINNYKILNLNANDGYEPFLLIITPKFQCILTIAGEKDKKILIMRNDQDSLKKIIELIGLKLSQTNLKESKIFKDFLENLGELEYNDEFNNNFWPNLSIKLANLLPNLSVQNSFKTQTNDDLKITEAKLLEAISHEVRTPLATIRTLISSTLRKYDMDETIKNRLIQINNECIEQIDRFGLIFNAAELVSCESSPPQKLTSIDLGEILQKLSPYWIAQLNRRGISLKIDIPKELPKVLSNSEKLELMLGGLIDKNTRGLREGSTLILELRPAGQKLKLQLLVNKKDSIINEQNSKFIGSDIGPVLNWNPQTGSLQISQSATQKLLASLGGHVTNRRNTGLTVFFPISNIN